MPQYDPDLDLSGLSDDELDLLLGMRRPPSALTPEPVAPAGFGRFLEGMSGLEAVQRPRPRGFGEGLVGGLSRGLGVAGTRAATERQRFEIASQLRQQTRDQANLEASRDYRKERGQALRDLTKEQRGDREQRAEQDIKFPMMTDELAATHKHLARMVGQRVPIEWLKPETPKEAKSPDLVEVTNPDGSKTLVPKRAGLVTSPTGGADKVKPPNEFQAKASLFYGRALDAEKAATEGGLEQRISKKAWGTKAPNIFKDPDQRAYTLAKQSFTLALNRLESGAAISPSEFSRVEELYFVKPGDDDETIKKKVISRRQTIDRLEKLQAPGDRAAASPASLWEPD